MKDELILLRCEKEEKQQIKRDAEEHDKCISDYIRYLVAKERKEMEGDCTRTPQNDEVRE